MLKITKFKTSGVEEKLKVYGYISDEQGVNNLQIMRNSNEDIGEFITKAFKYADLLQKIFVLIDKGLIKV